MLPSRLANYLLSNRKRLALTQEDIAFLLGAESGEKICRHERFSREASLEDAMAYEVIYRRSVSELFSGKYQKIEAEIAARAKELLADMSDQNLTEREAQRRQIIAELAGLEM